MPYPLVAVVVGDVAPVVGVHAVGDHEARHPLRAVPSALGHHSGHLRKGKKYCNQHWEMVNVLKCKNCIRDFSIQCN